MLYSRWAICRLKCAIERPEPQPAALRCVQSLAVKDLSFTASFEAHFCVIGATVNAGSFQEKKFDKAEWEWRSTIPKDAKVLRSAY